MADFVFDPTKRDVWDRAGTGGGGIDVDTDVIKAMLVTAVPSSANQGAWVTYSDASGIELANGSGYTTGGVTVTVTGAVDTTNHRAIFTAAANPSWAAATFTGVYGMILYKSHATSANTRLIAFYDFGGTKNAGGGTFTVQLSSSPSAFTLFTNG